MSLVLPIAAAAAVVAFIATRKPRQVGRDPNTGIRAGFGEVHHSKGRSGTEWDTQIVEAPTKPLKDGGAAVTQVVLNDPKIPARRHMVIEFMQVGGPGGPVAEKRTLVTKGPSTPALIQMAIADFGVTGPAAEAAAKGA